MTALNFVAKLKPAEAGTLQIFEENSERLMADYMDVLLENYGPELADGDAEYLGYLALCLMNPGFLEHPEETDWEKVREIIENSINSIRAFIDGIDVGEGAVVVYYRAAHDAACGFWKQIVANSQHFTKITVCVDDDYPEDEEEMGEGWRLVCKREGLTA